MSADPYTHTDGFWLGRISVQLAESISYTSDRHTKEALKRCLAEFIESPVPSDYLRQTLRPYLNGGKR